MKAYIGLDIGGTKILGALYDEHGKCLATEKKRTKSNEGEQRVIKQICKVIDVLLEVNKGEVEAIGAGAPGIIKDESKIVFSPNLPFDDFNLGDVIATKYNIPFILGNDVNVAMLGEWQHGKFRDKKNIVGLFIGTGIGGAIIINGELYTGMGAAGELGHMVINPDGIKCGCGALGCLEAYASKTGIQKSIIAALDKGKESILSKRAKDEDILKSSEIEDAYKENDSVTVKAVDKAIDYLGIAVGNYVNIFHPELFILGGGLIEAMGDVLVSKIIEKAKTVAMPGLMKNIEIQRASLGDEAGIYGAYQLSKTFKIK